MKTNYARNRLCNARNETILTAKHMLQEIIKQAITRNRELHKKTENETILTARNKMTKIHTEMETAGC